MTRGEIRVGMQARIVGPRRWYWNNEGLMDEYIDRIVTITETFGNTVKIKEDSGRWSWSPEDFESVAQADILQSVSDEDLKSILKLEVA